MVLGVGPQFRRRDDEPEKRPNKSELINRLRKSMEESLKTLVPPSNLPPMLANFIAGAARTRSTFTRTMIRHFAETLAEELIDDIKS